MFRHDSRASELTLRLVVVTLVVVTATVAILAQAGRSGPDSGRSSASRMHQERPAQLRQQREAGIGASVGAPAPTVVAMLPEQDFLDAEGISDWSAFPPEKQAALASQATAYAYGKTHRANKDAMTPGPDLHQVDPTPKTGVFEGTGEAPFPASMFKVQNLWQGWRNGNLVILYAGSDGQDTQQGVIYLETIPPGDQGATDQRFESTLKAGAVRITSVNGNLVTLVSTSGVPLIFNLDTHSFVTNP